MQTTCGSHDQAPTREIGAYFACLWLAVGLGSSIATVPIQFYVKEQLHLGPQAAALFGAIIALPLYVGFLFGLLRDRWQPFGRGDRGYLLLAAPPAALSLVWLAAGQITYARLLIGVLLFQALLQLLLTATQALTTAVAQRRLMTGRLGVVSMLSLSVPVALAALTGGWMVHRISAPGVFGVTAGILTSVFALAFWKPGSVYGEKMPIRTGQERIWTALRRLVRHRPLWPAVLILLLWNFSPGFQTPLFYYFTDRLKVSGDVYGLYVAVFMLSFLPTSVLYGALCRRQPLWRLLGWGTAFAVIQVLPILLCRTTLHLMLFASAAGLLGGFGTAAYFDLLFRSCPTGLEGTASMLAISGVNLAVRGGDLFGTWLYQRGSFTLPILLTTVVYLLIIPVLFFIPRSLVATREEEEVKEAPHPAERAIAAAPAAQARGQSPAAAAEALT